MTTEEELKKIAAQLRCPEGEYGVMMGENMNDTNIGMTRSSLGSLEVKNQSRILEIGYGNAGHIAELMSIAQHLSYTGIDISDTMRREASQINAALMLEEDISFDVYDGESLPYLDYTFDRIFTVNTIYFWEKPVQVFREINRVLTDGGLFALTFADKAFMKTLPFTKYGFTLYSSTDIPPLATNSGLQLLRTDVKAEHVRSKAGDFVERKYYVMLFRKSLSIPSSKV